MRAAACRVQGILSGAWTSVPISTVTGVEDINHALLWISQRWGVGTPIIESVIKVCWHHGFDDAIYLKGKRMKHLWYDIMVSQPSKFTPNLLLITGLTMMIKKENRKLISLEMFDFHWDWMWLTMFYVVTIARRPKTSN